MRDQRRALRARVGRIVRALRLQRGWSQEQLAERANSSTKHVGRIERGEVNVGLDALADLARALSVQIGDLVAESPARQAHRQPFYVLSSEDVALLEKIGALSRRLQLPRARPSRSSGR